MTALAVVLWVVVVVGALVLLTELVAWALRAAVRLVRQEWNRQ